LRISVNTVINKPKPKPVPKETPKEPAPETKEGAGNDKMDEDAPPLEDADDKTAGNMDLD
jgi:outer membrane biosynthesis protein TonB